MGRLVSSHHVLDLGNSCTRLKTLGASLAAVHDGVASVNRHLVLKSFTTLSTKLITRVNHPAVSLHQHSGTKVLLLQQEKMD